MVCVHLNVIPQVKIKRGYHIQSHTIRLVIIYLCNFSSGIILKGKNPVENISLQENQAPILYPVHNIILYSLLEQFKLKMIPKDFCII